MTKNTTKRKKRKNLKLRRTIRKTVAALIMIMAVIVAGLPVENLGTMRAQNASAVNIPVQDLYSAYENSIKATDKENELVEDGGVPDATDYNKDDWDKAAGDKKTVRIEDNGPGTAKINWEYKMKDRADGTYVIVDHNEKGGFGDNVVIDQVMNTEYFVITNDMFEKAIAIFEGDEYVARFAKTGESIVYQVPNTDITYTNLPIISTTDYDEGESIYKEGSFESEINGENRTFMIRRHSESFNFEMLRKYSTKFSDLWNAKIAKINEYNSLVDSLIKRIEVSDGNPTDIQWMDKTKAKIDELRPLCERFDEVKYTDIATTELEKVCLINRLSYQHKTYNISMDGFEMLTVGSFSDPEFDAKYIPRWVNKGYGNTPSEDCNNYDYKINGVVSDRAQFLDDKGYIWLDFLETSGIGNNAFEGETISSVSFPDAVSFNFIGNEAFKQCGQLTTIDLTGIKTIGNRAFYECTNLTNVKFVDDENNVGTTVVLGAEAFRKTKVANITFPITLEVIGRGCFAESDIQRFLVQKDTRNEVTIWPFAFYDCKSLVDVDDTFFPKDMIKGVRFGMGAFAVSSDGNSAMASFTFPHVMEKIIAESSVDVDEFLLEDAVEKVFTDKGRNHPITAETYYDYILAGRSNNLKKVTFPYMMGNDDKNNKIPDNTLRGCKNLECVVFGDLCLNNSNTCTTYDVLAPGDVNIKQYDTDEDGEVLFSDITNNKFYVEGPGYAYKSVSESSEPRKVTAKAQTKVSNSIPYIFLVSDNPPKEQIEMSYGANHSCLAVMEVISDNTDPKEVKLVKYVDNSIGNEMIDDLVIESMIGNYKLKELGENCFANVKDKVIEFTIMDGSVTSIETNAFSGSKSLQRVNIGNSVEVIGENAFAGCSKLENVYFSSILTNRNINVESDDSEWAKQLTIGENAFKTGSSYLTFHGDIHSGYAPYELAMSKVAGSPFEFGNSGRTICYKTDAPQNLTVVYDFQTGKSTLIDYPHYEEIDDINAKAKEKFAENKGIEDELYKISGNFEKYNGWETSYNQEATVPETDEAAIIAATYNIELPDGIQAIDVKNFILFSKNKPNVDYLYLSYEEKDDGSYKTITDTKRKLNGGTGELKELYSNDNAGSGSDVARAGLFSGYFKEEGAGIVPSYNSTKEYLGKPMHKEDITSGNDQLLEITLNTVEKLPNYAFESCENLNSVGFGTKLAELGIAPFRGCGNLTNVNTVKNPYFTCELGIIYHKPDDLRADEALGTGYVIEECLVARGAAMGYKSINATTDSLLSQVTGVKQEAFAYCPNIQTIDLSETKISEIPQECFRASSSLMEVVLPETVTNIGEKAFSETTAKVTIYSTNCQIESNAFDKGCGIIKGYKYADGTNTKYSTVYQYAQNHNIPFEEIDAKYTLRFLDFDGSAITTQLVDAGKDGVEPTWTPTRKGYKFKEWSWEKTDKDGKLSIVTGDKAYRNVTENRIILATYTVGNGIASDGNDYELTIEGGKNIAGENKIKIKGGTAVSIIADEKSGSSFQYWSDSTGKYSELFEDIHSGVTTFIMPNETITITAHYTDGSTGSESGSGSGTGNGSSTGNGSGSGDSETKYKLTVNYGSGTGEYKAGEVVSISAFAPESSSKVFSKWTSTNTGVGFASPTSATTTLTMPASAVTVTANYKTRTADDDDDSELEALNKRKPTSTTATVTTGTNNATVTTTTGTVTNATTTATTPTGDSITINKGGISNTGVASTQVEGAADNFVVKVTDSTDAVTQAEEALKNKYGSLDGILYFPMDISLYDVTGKNLIEDTTGLDVNITLPIPDELIQYGGNVRIAAIENGQLRDLNVRFTTIDGIACMSFVPPHFSPYVVYVDTNNLAAGQMLDATPKTGDPIHPKWFLAMGMACLSVILFTTGDRKKKIKMA